MPTNTGVGLLSFLRAGPPEALTGPVSLSATGMETPTMVVTRYGQARALLRDPRWRRKPANAHTLMGPVSAMSITEMDPPRHTIVRGLLGRMFSARGVAGLREPARLRAIELCDRMLSSGPPTDLISRFCAPFTFSVHCDLLGIPERSRAAIREVSLRRSDRSDATAQERYDAEVALHTEVGAVLTALRQRSGQGVYAELINMHQAGVLTAQQLTGLAASLLFDGHILASAQIANSVAALLCDAGAQRDAFDERGLRPTALEELLRWSPAITLGMPRTASVPLMLDDGVVEAGQTAVVAFGLVNRDPDIFEHPELLDLRRESNKHLAFGYGMHYCLGSHLARLELAIALTVLFSRLPGLTLDIEERDLTWSASHTIRRLLALPVTWQSGAKPAGSVR